jgi:energy-coupling factor transporter ATP-binding protein EcfA2
VSLSSNIELKEAAKKIIESAGEQVQKYATILTPDKQSGLFEPIEGGAPDDPESGSDAVIPIPDAALRVIGEHVKKIFYVEKYGTPSHVWVYRNEKGEAWACTARHEKGDKKDIIPYKFCNDGKWHAGAALKSKKPLFGIHKVKTGDKILVVEGEKCASVKVPGYSVVTWMGGATKGVKKADWSLLKGYDVLIWPDNDQPGIIAACEIQDLLPGSRILKIVDKPEKWDIADAASEGIDIVSFIQSCEILDRDEKSEPEGADCGIVDSPISIIPPSDFTDMSQVEQIACLIDHYLPEMRRNSITEHVEYLDKPTGKFLQVTDRQTSSLQVSLYRTRLFKNLSLRNFELVMGSDFIPEYNPITDYFNTLEPWDGKDYIQELADCVEVKQDQFSAGVNANAVWRDYLQRWLVASVAQMLGVSENHTCLTLMGDQGVGKTTFLKALNFDSQYTYVGAINPEDKDSKSLYTSKTLIVLDELESTTKRDLSALKSNMTLDSITIRMPYGRRTQTMRRLASFCGCANNIDVLGDVSGTRRWLCIETGKRIDFMKVTPELMKNVYSQCKHLLNTGYKFWFDHEEIADLHKNNSQFMEISAEQELLYKYFMPGTVGSSASRWMTTTDIMTAIMADYKASKISMKKLGHLLRHGGFPRTVKKGVYGYMVNDVEFSQSPALPLDDPFSDDKIPI